KVARINQGCSPIEGQEPGLDELVESVVRAGRLHATTDYADCQRAEIVIIAVETPIDADTRRPRYTALRSALTSLGPHLREGALVVVESTIAPRTMRDVVQPILEWSSDRAVDTGLFLAHCPERLTPRRLLRNLKTLPRVVGGATPEATELAMALYRQIVDAELDPTDCLTAELVKTAENAYRDVQIAFANELALTCESVGGDVWTVRQFMNKLPGREILLPGAGVGGHCIPKDPWLLISSAEDRGFSPRLIPVARAVNDGMPFHVADLTVATLERAGRPINGSRIVILGYAYLENSDDARNSPSEALANRLRTLRADVVVHDPYVPAYRGSLGAVVAAADCLVLMVAHDAYRELDWPALRQAVRTPLIVDGRNILGDDGSAMAAGFMRATLGVATPGPEDR
ncbi:MAG TPA: nucleotide sugar dehydrogenase, partial [Chloroflexota bacterium]|nr:nucleotide sugar dehydrogenase [Chloroflexota bacterium]